MQKEMMWKDFISEVCALAEREHQDYYVYELESGYHGYMGQEEYERREYRLPRGARLLATVDAEPTAIDSQTTVQWRLASGLDGIASDKHIHLKPQMGKPSKDRGKRVQAMVTDEDWFWLQDQRENYDSISDVLWRLIRKERGVEV